jgi:hypothetical protein
LPGLKFVILDVVPNVFEPTLENCAVILQKLSSLLIRQM